MAVVASAALLITRSEHEQERALQNRFDARQATAARFIEAFVTEVFDRERALGSRIFSGAVEPGEFAQFCADQGYDAAVLVSGGGLLLASQPANPATVGRDMSAKYAHLRSAVSGVPAVSGVVPSAIRGVPIVGFAVPFETPTGRRVFSGAYAVEDTPLAPFIRNATPFRTSNVVIVDAAGIVVAGSALGEAGRPLEEVDGILAGVAAERRTVDTPAGERYISQSTIAGTTWRLIFSVESGELLAPVRSTARWVPWVALGAFGIAALAALAGLYRYVEQRAKLIESEARRRTILDTAGDGFIGMDESGRITDWNVAATVLLGWSATEAIGQPLAELIVPPEHRIAHLAGVSRFLDTGRTSLPAGATTVLALRKDGTTVNVEFSLSRMRWGSSWRFHAFLHDISERLEHESQLRELALTDALTGLANRRAAVNRVEQALSRAHRHQNSVAALYIDVDRFKAINDRHGHSAGDAVLIEIGSRLRQTFRAEDTIARLGGDEFLVVCEDLHGAEGANVLARRTRAALARPYVVAGVSLNVTASVGLAITDGNTTFERLLATADAEMYDEKATSQAFTAIVEPRVP
ncbi:MAG: diguanylate cyclase [Mycobacteriales bacterium]